MIADQRGNHNNEKLKNPINHNAITVKWKRRLELNQLSAAYETAMLPLHHAAIGPVLFYLIHRRTANGGSASIKSAEEPETPDP